MNKEVFLEELAEVLEVNKDELNEEFELSGWDSLAVMSTIAIIDHQFGITVPAKRLSECTSVGALLELVSHSLAQALPEA